MFRSSRSSRRLPRIPGILRLPRRVDTLLVLLVFIICSLLYSYFGSPQGEVSGVETSPLPEPKAPVACLAPESRVDAAAMPRTGEPVRFLMFNVQNYFVAGEQARSRYINKPKPEKSADAVAEVIASAAPDVVGLVEMGGPRALSDLRLRLQARGAEYPYYRVLIRNGEDRALAVLSKLPIAEDGSRADYPLLGQQRRRMLRGILDVTVAHPDGRCFRVLGVHLKSRVAQDTAAADALRAREARTVSMYLQQTMRQNPKLPVLVYGDWNDGPADLSLGILTQGVSADAALSRLSPRDSAGEEWTLYFKAGNEYSVFDQIYVNKALRGRLKDCKNGIVDMPASRSASDHRAVWCELR